MRLVICYIAAWLLLPDKQNSVQQWAEQVREEKTGTGRAQTCSQATDIGKDPLETSGLGQGGLTPSASQPCAKRVENAPFRVNSARSGRQPEVGSSSGRHVKLEQFRCRPLVVLCLQTLLQGHGGILLKLCAALAGGQQTTVRYAREASVPQAATIALAATAREAGKGGQKSKPGYQAAEWSCPPWKPGERKTHTAAPAPLSVGEDNGQLQELVGAIRTAFSGQNIPGPLAEVVAKVESSSEKKVTKDLHSKTAELSQARRQMQAIRKARDVQTSSWLQFLQSTAEALEKGSAEFESKKAELDAREKEARQKAGAARKAIRELASSSTSRSAEVIADSDSFSDMEVGEAKAMDEDDTMAQTQKKLRVTLTELLSKIPDAGADTPRRRVEKKPDTAPPS